MHISFVHPTSGSDTVPMNAVILRVRVAWTQYQFDLLLVIMLCNEEHFEVGGYSTQVIEPCRTLRHRMARVLERSADALRDPCPALDHDMYSLWL